MKTGGATGTATETAKSGATTMRIIKTIMKKGKEETRMMNMTTRRQENIGGLINKNQITRENYIKGLTITIMMKMFQKEKKMKMINLKTEKPIWNYKEEVKKKKEKKILISIMMKKMKNRMKKREIKARA